MGGRLSLWLMLVVSLLFVAAGAFLLWANRDPGALMPMLFFGACAAVFTMKLREGRARTRTEWPELRGDTILLRRSSKAIWTYAVISIAMGVGCGMISFMAAGTVEYIIGVAGLVFFGGGGIAILLKGGRNRIALRADEQGIGFGGKAHPRLRWQDLGGVGMVSMHGEAFLGFTVRESVDIRTEDHAAMRMAGRLNESLGLPDFTVARTGLDVPLEQVALAVERLWERYA